MSTRDDRPFVGGPTSPVDLFNELSGATAYAEGKPKRRWSHAAKGKVLFFPRTDMVMVPFEMHRDGSWSCVVVVGDPKGVYKPDGYSLNVGAAEIETAIEVNLQPVLQIARLSRLLQRLGRALSPGTPAG